LAIHLSVNNLAKVVRELVPLYGADCPVVVAYRVSWRAPANSCAGRSARSGKRSRRPGFTRTALILVGRVLGEAGFSESRLLCRRSPPCAAPARGQGGRGINRALPGAPERSGPLRRCSLGRRKHGAGGECPSSSVVDDDPAMRELMARLVEAGGHCAVLAEGGYQGLEVFVRFGPDLVVTDMSMPAGERVTS